MTKMKKNIHGILMSILIVTLVISPVLALIPVQAQILQPPPHDLRGTWTWNYYRKQNDPSTHIMIINTFDLESGDFEGTGRQTDDLTATWEITGNEFWDEATERYNVTFTITYTGVNDGVILIEDAQGHILPADPNNELPMRMVDWTEEPPLWVAIKRPALIELLPDTEGELQVAFPDGSSIDTYSASRNPPGIPPPSAEFPTFYNIDVTGTFGTDLIVLCIRLAPAPLNPRQLHLVQYTILGDVNDDGEVTPKDTLLIIRAMNHQPGDKKWNRRYDLNHDRQIDLQDVVICLQRQGQTQPMWEPIPTIVKVFNNFIIVCGFPDHFSGWGIRR
jgi:hypothetical protein